MIRLCCKLANLGVLLGCLSMAGTGTLASPRTPEQEQLLNQIRERDVNAIAKAGQLPEPEVFDALFEVISRTTQTKEHNQAAQKMLASMEGFPAWMAEKVRNTPHYYENKGERTELITIIGRFRQRWALDLLAEMVEKDEPLGSKLPPDELEYIRANEPSVGEPNSRYAANALVRMRLSNFPVTVWRGGVDPDQMEAIREWLRANKEQPDAYFFDPSALAKEPTWTQPDPAFAGLGRVTAWDIKPPNQIPPPKPALPPPPQAEPAEPTWLWWGLGGLAVALGVSYWLRFRKSQSENTEGI